MTGDEKSGFQNQPPILECGLGIEKELEKWRDGVLEHGGLEYWYIKLFMAINRIDLLNHQIVSPFILFSFSFKGLNKL